MTHLRKEIAFYRKMEKQRVQEGIRYLRLGAYETAKVAAEQAKRYHDDLIKALLGEAQEK